MGAFETKAWIENYAEWTDPYPELGSDTLVSMFNQIVANSPKNKATWFMGKELTYGQLNEKVSNAAAALVGIGVRSGDRVAVALPNCPQHVICLLYTSPSPRDS